MRRPSLEEDLESMVYVTQMFMLDRLKIGFSSDLGWWMVGQIGEWIDGEGRLSLVLPSLSRANHVGELKREDSLRQSTEDG